MYELFEHTADLGLRVRAPDLDGLFVEAGRGFASVIIENAQAVRPAQAVTIDLHASDLTDLFFDWLNELLYLFDAKHLLLVDFEVQVGDGRFLTARARGETYDGRRHRLDHEIKAITYHQLSVRQVDDSWEAEVIVDI